MNMQTIIAVIAVALILFFAIRYIYKEKKRGVVCIGCPHAGTCSGHCSGGSDSCGCPTDSN